MGINVRKIMALELQHPHRGENNISSNKFKKMTIDEWLYKGRQIITIGQSSRHIIYLHGGAYVSEASVLHVRIIRYFLKHGYKVTFIDYPVAPESDYIETNQYVLDIYNRLIKKYSNDIFFVFGDSAGGGLGLSLLEQIVKLNINKISASVLFSPWVDLTMSNPDIADYTKKDFLLPLSDVKRVALLYAKDGELTNNLISPIYGSMENIGDVLLFSGSNELLYPDIIKLYRKLREVNYAELIVGKNMQHDWILLPIKKSQRALKHIVEFYDKR